MTDWYPKQHPEDRAAMDDAFMLRLERLRRWLLDPRSEAKRAALEAAFLGEHGSSVIAEP